MVPSRAAAYDVRRCHAVTCSALIHWHREFDRIVLVRFWGKHGAARLQIAPVQRAIDAVEGENDASFRPFDPNLHETLEERGMIKIEQARQCLDAGRPALEPFDPLPERLFP